MRGAQIEYHNQIVEEEIHHFSNIFSNCCISNFTKHFTRSLNTNAQNHAVPISNQLQPQRAPKVTSNQIRFSVCTQRHVRSKQVSHTHAGSLQVKSKPAHSPGFLRPTHTQHASRPAPRSLAIITVASSFKANSYRSRDHFP